MTMTSTDGLAAPQASAPAGAGRVDAAEGARRLAAGSTAGAVVVGPGEGPRALLKVLEVPHLGRIVRTFCALSALCLVAAFAVGGGPLVVIGAFLGGLLYWSLIEYLVHRFVLHWEPTVPWQQAIRKRINNHSSHHDKPDKQAVYANPHLAGAVAIGATMPVVMLALGFPLPIALAASGGAYLGYVGTEYLHAALHVLPMKGSAYARWLNRFHSIHHYRDDRYNHAVLNPLWDYVFGSAYIPKRSRARRRG